MSLIQAVLTEHGYTGEDIPDTDKWISVLCPYHSEEKPSARVNGHLGAFKCLACGVSGDCLKLLRKEENLDYAGAQRRLEKIAAEIGYELPRAVGRQPGRPRVFGGSRDHRGDSPGVRPRFRG